MSLPVFGTEEIIARRPPRNSLNPKRPYAFLVEKEHSASGEFVDVATLFLTNSECPFHCLMCDLWKNALDRNEPSADVVEQIRFALDELPTAREIKLYNSGNFFDPKAIPRDQYEPIAELVRHFETVVVENHPKLCGADVLKFRDLIAPSQLEVAMGLETCHPEVLPTLNKQMTLIDFEKAANFLHHEKIRTRTFILLRPPFLTEEQGMEWAIKSIEYAFDLGINCCSVVPTRATNGIMEMLAHSGQSHPPSGASMETVLATGLEMKRGRVFMDLWDAEQFFDCEECRSERIERLAAMNLSQRVIPSTNCSVCHR